MVKHSVVASVAGWVCVRTFGRDAWWMTETEYKLRLTVADGFRV